MSINIASIVSWALFTLFISFLLQFAYYTISFVRVKEKTKGVFDNMVVNNTPPSESEIEEKINTIRSASDYRGRSMFFGTLSVFSCIICFLIKPDNHPLSSDTFSLFFLITCGTLVLFLKFFAEIDRELISDEKKLSFIEYGLISDHKISLIRSAKASKEYLRAVALSERKITNYEIDMLEEFAISSNEKAHEASIIELITSE